MQGLTILPKRQAKQEEGREELPCLWLKWEFRGCQPGPAAAMCPSVADPQCSPVTNNPYTHRLSQHYQPINVKCADKQINIKKEFLISEESHFQTFKKTSNRYENYVWDRISFQEFRITDVVAFAFDLSRGRGISPSSRPSWSTQ